MNILIVTQCFPPDLGGIEHVMGNIAINSSRLNHLVTIVADESKKPYSDFDKDNKFSIKRFGQIKYFRRLQKANYVNKLLLEKKFDRIFFDSWKSIEKISIKNQSNKFICLVHGNEILKDKNKHRINKSLFKANTIIFNSQATKNIFIKKFLNYKLQNSNIIYPAFINNIDQSKSQKKTYDFCTIARLDRRKGHQLVLEALKKIKDDDKLILTYAILGTGDELSILKSKVQKLSLEKQVFFLENIDSNKVLKISKIHLLPTFLDGNSIEGFGIANVEASAIGVPCIVSTSGGTPESVKNYETGIVVSENSIEDLYYAMKILIEDKNKYDEFSNNSIEFAKNFLSDKKILEYLNTI